jgi:hypothetical protein
MRTQTPQRVRERAAAVLQCCSDAVMLLLLLLRLLPGAPHVPIPKEALVREQSRYTFAAVAPRVHIASNAAQ